MLYLSDFTDPIDGQELNNAYTHTLTHSYLNYHLNIYFYMVFYPFNKYSKAHDVLQSHNLFCIHEFVCAGRLPHK